MNPNKRIYSAICILLLLGMISCKKQLNVGDPNDPNLTANASDEHLNRASLSGQPHWRIHLEQTL